MKLIRLEDVSRAYGRHFALHRVSTQFDAGTLTALLGGNGAGKTTLLNILATLETPTQGEVFYDKNPWQAFARRGRRHVGWVSHEPLLYETLTGRENLRFFAQMYGLAQPDKIIDQRMEEVAITHAADHPIHTYSRGMVQRLTIARALLHNPSLLLLDEPLTGLDRQGRASMKALFSQLRSEGKILIMSTHDLHILQGLCDRLHILKQGRLVWTQEIDSTHDIIQAYEAHA